MGRSYLFECSKCGLRATVAGGPDKGIYLGVQTICCRDCKKLYDAVVKLRVEQEPRLKLSNLNSLGPARPRTIPQTPPSFAAALNRLPPPNLRLSRWISFRPRCPISASHKIEVWKCPGKCPRCGVMLDQNAVPFRVWD